MKAYKSEKLKSLLQEDKARSQLRDALMAAARRPIGGAAKAALKVAGQEYKIKLVGTKG